ncbi:hypothetical protein F0562_021536 [Nyssa sinensis]|uniref:acetyl-CoA carboxytransferase n=1 Tax=Nyssa sinensis TaxID=561372 RepID=A0A5J5BJK2_9ASTE|nr:hypothetical protein F0562_021536 [Nyssa sinensis]
MEDIDKDGIDVGDISNDERNNGNDEGNNENMGNEKNDTQNEDADPHKHAFQRKPRKITSTIWNDFEEVVDADGSKKKCFIEWEIEDKVSIITVDNAKYNDVALRILKDNFTLKKKLSFGGRIFHVRCCAHIINLLVQDGIKEVKGIVNIVREGVKYLIASDSRIIQFSDITKQLQLSAKKLILDCPTHWNITYMMLATALEFREVFPRYEDRNLGFIYVPSVEDWVKVEHVCDFLGTFNVVTNIISGTEYPTANLFLSELWRIKVILNEKSVDDNDFIRAMASMMKAKFDKYWSECNLLMAIAAVLDPRYKMIIVNYCFPDIYPKAEANRNIATVKQALYEIYNEYIVTHAATHTAQGEGGHGTTREIGSSSASGGDHDIGKKIVTGSSLILGHVSRIVDTIQPSKSDLDIYLEESAFICAEGSANKFDIMEWWKANTLKFRILSKMACEILSIPITSVASKSTFSAGGRVIDLYRASLLPETIQVLLCGADWVCALHGLKKGSKWVELHRDRAGYDDLAIVTGIGSIDGKSYMFIGHQKGRNTKENIIRNLAMPTPHGYRTTLRMMKYANHHGFPIVTFVDTLGAFADLKSEELGQDDLTTTLVEQCHQSQFIVQRIIEIVGDNEALLFEALNVNDEIQKVLLKYEDLNKLSVVPPELEFAMIPVAVEPDDSPLVKKEDALGLPLDIVSDRDARFTGRFWTALFKMMGSKLNFSTSNHPQTDGHTERVKVMLEEYMRHYVTANQENWVDLLDVA